MAVVLTDETDQEARRILSSSNAFDVLQLTITTSSREEVLHQYTTISEPFRKAVRNRLAAEARERLDKAKMALLDPVLRGQEIQKLQSRMTAVRLDQEELELLASRTRMLEAKAESWLKSREMVPRVP